MRDDTSNTTMPIPVRLPAEFVGGRILVKPTTRSGVSFTFITDTGGSMLIKPDAVRRAGLQTLPVSGSDEQTFQRVRLSEFSDESWIPGVDGDEGMWLLVIDDDHEFLHGHDGLLGQEWFANRVWTFDYLRRELLLGAATKQRNRAHACPLGFKTDKHGNRLTSFPRIQAVVEGKVLDFLFDTGATVHLTDKAYRAIGDSEPTRRGTCFVTTTIFGRWQQRHADWTVIESADELLQEAMIQVPQVEIGGFRVGPVWFTRRPDTNFHDYMSNFMDQRVEGTLGGSLLKYFSVVLDYPNAVAYFEERFIDEDDEPVTDAEIAEYKRIREAMRSEYLTPQ